jgi:hypothetical protein
VRRRPRRPFPPCRPAPAAGQQRAELIGSLDYSARQRRFQSEQELLQGHEDVTAALRRTRQMMRQNVEQQAGNLSVLGARVLRAGGGGMAGPVVLRRRSEGRLSQARALSTCLRAPAPQPLAPPAAPPPDSSNTKLAGTRDELHGQKQVFKQSHGLLGMLKRQATMQWCAGAGQLPLLTAAATASPRLLRGHLRPACTPLVH